MSEPDSSRRVIAEIRFGTDRSVIAKIGSRSIHQYWHLLAPDFQGILLAPQRRPDEGGVAWIWRETAGNQPLTAPELAGVRERLTKANRSFAKNLPDSGSGADGPGGRNPQESADQLRSKVDEIVTKLVGKSDDKLAAFVARTEAGPMLHCWGASVPAQPYYPDAHNCEVSGVVLVGDKDAADFEVLIESRKGVCLARTRSDASGAFHFEKIGPGTHRVRVISDRVDFPVNGVAVTVERTSITNLELRSTSLNVASAIASPTGSPLSAARMVAPAAAAARQALGNFSRATPRRRWLVVSSLAVLAVVVAAGGWWTWRWWHSGDQPAGHGGGAFPTDVRPLSAGGKQFGSPPSGTARAPDTGLSAGAARGTPLQRSRAPFAPSSLALAAASAKSPSTEPARAVGASSMARREPLELASALDRPAASARKGGTEGILPDADAPSGDPLLAEETAAASETLEPGPVPGALASPAIHKSPKPVRAAGGKTRKATPVASTATRRESANAGAPSAKPMPASASRAAPSAAAAVTQADGRSPAAGIASAVAAAPAAGDAVGSPEPGEGSAAAVAASDKQPATTRRFVTGKSGSALQSSGARFGQASLAASGPSTNPAPASNHPAATPTRTEAVKKGRALSHKESAPAGAAPPAEAAPADDTQDSDASSDVGEAPPPDQKPGTSVTTVANEVRSTAPVAGTAFPAAALPASVRMLGAVPDSDRRATEPATTKAARAGKGSLPESASPKNLPTLAETAPESDSPDSDANSAPPSASPPDQKSAMPAAAKEAPVRTTAPVAAVASTDAPSPAAAATVNPAATPGSPSAKRSSVVPKTQSTRAPNRSEREPGADGGIQSEITAVPAEAAAAPSPKFDAGKVSEPGRLARAVQVRISAWTPRLVQDVILPTQPVRDGEDDTMELLRERLFRERREQIPQTLKHPVVKFGFALEIPANGDGLQLRWRDAVGREPAGATVRGQRAEISWSGGSPPRDVDYVLGCPGHREIARITTDPQGGLVLEAAKDVSCRYWVAVERASADEAGLPRTQGATRFDWRLLHGAHLPTSCVRDDNWLGGRGQRLDLPVGVREGGTATCSLALVDRITGWAIVSEVSQEADSAMIENAGTGNPGNGR